MNLMKLISSNVNKCEEIWTNFKNSKEIRKIWKMWTKLKKCEHIWRNLNLNKLWKSHQILSRFCLCSDVRKLDLFSKMVSHVACFWVQTPFPAKWFDLLSTPHIRYDGPRWWLWFNANKHASEITVQFFPLSQSQNILLLYSVFVTQHLHKLTAYSVFLTLTGSIKISGS